MSKIKLGVRSWSFRKFLPDAGLRLEDFLRTASEMGLDGVEILARHFPRFTEEAALRYRDVARGLGIRIEAYALENDFAFPSEKVRNGELQNAYTWVRLAACAGVSYLKIFTGDAHPSADYDTQRGWVMDCLRRLADYAQAYGVTVLVENHSAICFDHLALRDLALEINHPALKLCPDVYNFSKYKAGELVYEAAELLLPLSPYGHLQFYEMDEDGAELHMDMPRLLAIYEKHGYEGFLMLEWEGESDPFPATLLQADYIRSLLR